MHKVNAKDFGLRCASNFAVPKPYSEDFLRAFISTSLQEFANYGIGAQNFAKNEADRLFGYAVSYSLFSGNAAFVLNRDGLLTTLLNGQDQRDAELMVELLHRAHRCLPELEKITHFMNAFCHAEFCGGGTVEKVFQDIIVTAGGGKAVAIGVLSEDPEEVLLPLNERLRLDIAPSELRENRLFMSWHFSARGVVSEGYWKTLVPRLKSLAGNVGIELVQ